MLKKAAVLFSLLLLLFTTLCTPASAANVCSVVRGNPATTTTFTVKTNKGFTGQKITLKQSGKGVAWGQTLSAKRKKYNAYATYKVKYTDMTTGKTVYKTWYTKTCSLYLKANRTYKVTVYYDSVGQLTRYRSLFNGGFFGWEKMPSWSVTKTRNITLCH